MNHAGPIVDLYGSACLLASVVFLACFAANLVAFLLQGEPQVRKKPERKPRRSWAEIVRERQRRDRCT
jgi:hypothetical protein